MSDKEELYNLYYKEKLSMDCIAQKLQISVGTVFNHMERLNIPHRTKSEGLKLAYSEGRKKPVILKGNKHWAYGKQLSVFIPTPSHSLAYVLGVLKGDGCVYKHSKRGWGILLICKSQKFANQFYQSLKNIGLNPILGKRKLYSSYSKEAFFPQVIAFHNGFARWYKSLDALESLLPDDKSKTAFVKGFYDSEGSSDTKRTRFSNTNYELQFFVQKLLRELGVKSSIHRNKELPSGKTEYALGVYGKESKRLQALMRYCYD